MCLGTGIELKERERNWLVGRADFAEATNFGVLVIGSSRDQRGLKRNAAGD
jgi:hypothetical protein